MRSRLPKLLVASLLAAVVWPAPSSADHISIEAGVGGALTKLKPTSAIVRVTWNATCIGAAPGADNYSGNLSLLRPDIGGEIYLGGVFGAGGEVDQLVSRGDKDQAYTPVLKISCFEDGSLHGSGDVVVSGAEVIVPAKERHGGGGGGGGGGGNGGGNGGGGGGDPDDPLHAGGCANELRGSNRPDLIEGTAAGDLVFALGGRDRVRGRDGHDCLIGGSGADRLFGGDGYDRLTGGSGADLLAGGPGANGYDAGSGDDRVEARNGRRERIRCGPGDDTARVDRNDRIRGCEHVRRG